MRRSKWVVVLTVTSALVGLGLAGTAEAAFPGTNGKIAFNGSFFIFTMNPDGSALTQLTHASGPSTGFIDRNAVWSRDGTQVAFDSDSAADRQHEQGFLNVWVINADGSGLKELTHSGDNRTPSWSPDGTKIAFAKSGRIFVMNAADGSAQTQLTASGSDASPAWSPDGAKIAFTSHRDGNDEIYVMNANGSGETNLSHNTAADDTPNWSPDGTKIAFTSHRDGNDEIYVMNANGSTQTDLTNNMQSDDHDPAWSPDGARIGFEGDAIAFTDVHIYVMNAADGSGRTQPTTFGGAFPDWQPKTSFAAPVSFSFSGQLPTITVPLAISTSVGILVERRVHGRFVIVGRVPLGKRHKGRNHIKWNLRVQGKRLKPGVYFVRVRLLNSHGKVFELSKRFRIRVP